MYSFVASDTISFNVCNSSNEEFVVFTKESQCSKRKENKHNRRLQKLQNSNLSKIAKVLWSKRYGVCSQSVLSQIP